jgi:hypothetical protein
MLPVKIIHPNKLVIETAIEIIQNQIGGKHVMRFVMMIASKM